MAGKSIIPQRSNLQIFKDWAKFTYKDMSDDILERAFGNGELLDSLEHKVISSGDKLEAEFTHLIHGAFQDMGVSKGGYTFKPNKWYAGNMAYSVNKLNEIFLARYGALGMARIREVFPEKIILG